MRRKLAFFCANVNFDFEVMNFHTQICQQFDKSIVAVKFFSFTN